MTSGRQYGDFPVNLKSLRVSAEGMLAIYGKNAVLECENVIQKWEGRDLAAVATWIQVRNLVIKIQRRRAIEVDAAHDGEGNNLTSETRTVEARRQSGLSPN